MDCQVEEGLAKVYTSVWLDHHYKILHHSAVSISTVPVHFSEKAWHPSPPAPTIPYKLAQDFSIPPGEVVPTPQLPKYAVASRSLHKIGHQPRKCQPSVPHGCSIRVVVPKLGSGLLRMDELDLHQLVHSVVDWQN